MFGFTTFSQAPFSTLAGSFFVVSIVEAISPQDSEEITNYNVNTTIVEGIGVADLIPYFHYPVAVDWTPIDDTLYGVTSTGGIMLGGMPFGAVAFSGLAGGSAIITPNWRDIVNN